MSVVERSGYQRSRLKSCILMISLPLLLYGCFKGKQGTEQVVDPSAPDKIKQLVPESCGACGGIINQVAWNGRTIYTYSCNGPACYCVTLLYDMNGDKIARDSATYAAFFKESIYVKTIWKCK